MQKREGQRTIVGEEKEPFALRIQPTDGIQTAQFRRNKVHHRRPSMVVMRSADNTRGLVQRNHDPRLRLHPTTIHMHFVRTGNEVRRIRDELPIHRHAPRRDQSLGGPTRGDTAMRQELPEAPAVPCYRIRSKIAATSTGTFRGSEATPTATRACGRSGKIWPRSSDAPLTTLA